MAFNQFDQMLLNLDQPMMNSPDMMDADCKIAHLVSGSPYTDEQDEADQAEPHLISFSHSEEEESITGRTNNIEHKYQIDPRILGTGHHGSVRECIDRSTGQRYAVKSICKRDPTVKAAGLAREMTLLQEMKHRNIIHLVDMYEDDEYVHLVTDLCAGGELFDKIVEKSQDDNGSPCFTEAEAAKIMYQLLQAVGYMHERGVAHRDIKPENILFETREPDSPVKIIDFGLSRKHHSSQKPMSTVVGTPYYIAPEVLRKSYTKSCDVWSSGVIAYIMLCGYPPFNGRNNDETHRSVMRGRYYFPAEDWKDISHEAMDFIYRMLQMDPKRRMTLQQALNHPWIVKHVPRDCLMTEDRQDNSSVEVLYEHSTPRKQEVRKTHPPTLVGGSPRKSVRKDMSPMRGGYSPPKRKVRISSFGL